MLVLDVVCVSLISKRSDGATASRNFRNASKSDKDKLRFNEGFNTFEKELKHGIEICKCNNNVGYVPILYKDMNNKSVCI